MTAIMLTSLVVVIASYLLVSWRDHSMMHFLTPTVALMVPTLYVFPWANLIAWGPSGSLYAYFFFYGTTAATVLVSALVYCFIKPPKIGWNIDCYPVERAHWYCLILSAIVFAPILVRFSSLLASPRDIYSQTRSAEGIYFFTSSFLLNLAFVFYLFAKNKSIISSTLFVSMVAYLSFLHGSKGQLIAYLWLWIMYKVYVEHQRFRFVRTVAIGAIPVLLMSFLFVFYQGAAVDDLFFAMARYSNYPEVAMMVIDDENATAQFGRITLESAFYSRVPRALFPSKPKKFGTFRLVAHYFQTEDWEDVGAPDFSIGIQYSDFREFAALYLCLWAAGIAYLSRGLVKSLEEGSSRANYALLAFFAGIVFIPTGTSYCLPEQLVLASFLALHGRIKIAF